MPQTSHDFKSSESISAVVFFFFLAGSLFDFASVGLPRFLLFVVVTFSIFTLTGDNTRADKRGPVNCFVGGRGASFFAAFLLTTVFLLAAALLLTAASVVTVVFLVTTALLLARAFLNLSTHLKQNQLPFGT